MVGAAMSEQAWAEAVAEQVRALEAAAVATDWSGAELCTSTLATLLATLPSADSAHTEAVFRHAYLAVGRVSAAARAAHDEVRTELRQLANARKAVSVYG